MSLQSPQLQQLQSRTFSTQQASQQQLYLDEEELRTTGRVYSESVLQMDPLKELDREIKESFFARHSVTSVNDFFKLADVSSFINEKEEIKQFDVTFDNAISQTLTYNTIDYGYPSAFCQSQQYLLVGTTFSLIYVFDKSELRMLNVAGLDKINESGKVTSVCINHDQLIFAVGFENGDIAIYELKGTELPRMTTMKKIFKAPVRILQFVSELQSSTKEFCLMAYDSQDNNLKIQVEVSIVFDKKFTTINKDNLSYVFKEQPQQEQQQQQQIQFRSTSDDLRALKLNDNSKISSKSVDDQPQDQIQNIRQIHSISYLDGIQSMKYFNKNYKILAVATQNSVQIGFILYKSIQFMFRFVLKREEEEEKLLLRHSQSTPVKLLSTTKQIYSSRNLSNPSISWGEGYFQGNTKNNLHRFPLLCIGLENHIFLISTSISETNQTLQFTQSAYAQLSQPLLSCSFISNSVIFIFFQDLTCALIHTSNFTVGRYDQSNNNKNLLTPLFPLDHIKELSKISKISHSIGQKLCYLMSESSMKFFVHEQFMFNLHLKPWQEYFNELISNVQTNADILSVMQQTIMVLTNRIKYLGSIQSDRTSRFEDMKPFIEKLSLKYLVDSLAVAKYQKPSANNSQDPSTDVAITTILTITIEFLLSTEHSNYLFNEIFQIVEQFHCSNQLLECLQPFIESSRIRVLPYHSIPLIFAYYAGKQRYDILQDLILSLDVSALDNSQLLVDCIKYELFNALIHIRQQQNDYLTPLLILLGNYDVKFKSCGFNTPEAKKFGLKILWYIQQTIQGRKIDGFDMEQSIMEEVLPNLVKMVFQEQNLRCILQIDRRIALDTIFQLFKGKAAEILELKAGVIKIDKQDELVMQFGVFERNELDKKDVIKEGSDLDGGNVKQEGQDDIIKYNISKLSRESSISSKSISQIFPFESIIAAILHCHSVESEDIMTSSNLSQKLKRDKLDEINSLETVFMSRIIELQTHPISITKQIEVVDYLVQNPQTFVYFEKPADNMIVNNGNSEKQQNQPIESPEKYNKKILTRNAFLISILRPLLPLIDDPIKFAHFASQAEINEFTEACCFVYNYQKNYRKCFSLYLESRNPLIKARIFDWIEQVLETASSNNKKIIEQSQQQLPQLDTQQGYQLERLSISPQDQLSLPQLSSQLSNNNQLQPQSFSFQAAIDELKELFINSVKSLVKLNSIRSKQLIVKYFSNQWQNIHSKLDQFPNDQLSILEEILEQTDKVVSDDLKLLHLKLLCKMRPDQVLSSLKARDLPSDAAIAICTDAHANDGLVFLLLKVGKYQEALEIQTKLLCSQWKESKQRILQQEQLDNQNSPIEYSSSPSYDQDKMLLSLHKAIEICLQSEKGDKSNDGLWIILFETVVVDTIGIPTLTSSTEQQEIVALATKIVSQLILEMANNIQLQQVLDQIHQNYKTIPLKAFLETNEYFREKFEFQTSSNTIASCILQDSILELQEKVHSIKNKGLSGSQMPDYRVCQMCEIPFGNGCVRAVNEDEIINNISSNKTSNNPMINNNNNINILAKSDILMFFCGHAFHSTCVKDYIAPLLCPICIENPFITLANCNTINGSKPFTKTGKKIPRKQSLARDDPFGFIERRKSSINNSNNGWLTPQQIQNSVGQAQIEKKDIIDKKTNNKIELMGKLSRFDEINKDKRSQFEDYQHLALID